MNNSNVERALLESREFRLSDYISGGFKLFQKQALLYIGFIVVFILIAIVGGGILGLIPFVGQLLSGILTSTLLAGGYIFTNKLNTGKNAEFGDFFAGFQKIQPIAIVSVLAQLATLVALIPLGLYFGAKLGGFGVLMDQTALSQALVNLVQSEGIGFSFILFVLAIPAILLGLLLSLAPMFVVLAGMEPVPALQASMKLTLPKLGWLFLFGIVWGIILMLSFIPCGLGLLATIPAYMCAMYLFFADHTDIEKGENGGQDLLNHFISR